MKCRVSGYRSDTELAGRADDQSLLWTPIQPLVSGFLEAKHVYENGTEEIRRLLGRECSLIYECNICRNMFRSLTSFISHKRVYCCMSSNHMGFNNVNGFQDPTLSSRPKDEQQEQDDNFGDLILRMLKGEKLSQSMNSTNVIVEPCVEQDQKQVLKPQNPDRQVSASANLLATDESGNDVCKESTEPETNIPFETITITRPTANNAADPANEAVDERSVEPVPVDCNDNDNVCDVCKLKFDTEKSLKSHIHKKHLSSRYAFQCPSCPLTFLQPAAVVRHLSNDHKKSIRCIKMMRDVILKRRILTEGISTATAENQEVNAVQENVPKSDKTSTCTHCDRTFQRRAALLTHQASCKLKKTKLEENTVVQRKTTLSKTNQNQATEEGKAYQKLEQSTDSAAVPLTASNEIIGAENPDKFCTDSTTPPTSKKTKQTHKYMPCLCKICNKHFSALSNLRRHISMFHYRTRKFGCKLCEYRAYRKYDVINHLGHVHNIMGDKDALSLNYIAVHEEQNCREDVDEDVVLITDDKRAKPKEESQSSDEHNSTDSIVKMSEPANVSLKTYKNKSHKLALITARKQKSVPLERQKLKRAISQQSTAKNDGCPTHQKRPRRNRVTPVKKDFVYDLATMLNKDANDNARTESIRSLKRGTTIVLPHNQNNAKLDAKAQRIAFCKPLISYSAELIRGAAQKNAVSCVHQGRAAYASLPQLPTERPQVRLRHASIFRADVSTASVIESTDLEAARLKSKLLDNSFLENLSIAVTDEFRMKPRLVMPQSTINSLLQKVDLTLQNQLKIKTEVREADDATKQDLIYNINAAETVASIVVKQEETAEVLSLADLAETVSMQALSADNMNTTIDEVGQTYSKLVCLPQKPRKRIKIMECLVDNKAKNRESLLRFALEN